MGGAQARRYIAGKTPSNYFASDIWPSHKYWLLKLGLDSVKALQLFKVFCYIDERNSGCISSKDFYTYVGGWSTKYTARLYEAFSFAEFTSETIEIGSFKYFVITIWSFCSLDTKSIARHVFEVFDPDRKGRLERPDVEAIYRFLYDCDEYDEKYVKLIPLTNLTIDKKDFMTFCANTSAGKHIIQPAIDIRSRMRSKFGGKRMWNTLEAYRHTSYGQIVETSVSLKQALVSMLNSEDRRPEAKLDAETEIRVQTANFEKSRRRSMEGLTSMRQQAMEIVAVKEEQENAVKEYKPDKERAVVRLIDTIRHEHAEEDYFSSLEDFLLDYENTVYNTDEVWDFHTYRQTLYTMFDHAVEAEDANRGKKEEEDMRLTVGVAEDHELRTDDYLETADGVQEYNRMLILRVLLHLLDEISKEKASKSLHFRSRKDIEISTGLIAINKLNRAIERREQERQAALDSGVATTSLKIAPKESAPTVERLMKVVNRYASKSQLEVCARRTRAELVVKVKERAIASMKEELRAARNERQRYHDDLLRRMVDSWGVRNSRWFLVLDEASQLMMYLNIDTLEVSRILNLHYISGLYSLHSIHLLFRREIETLLFARTVIQCLKQ